MRQVGLLRDRSLTVNESVSRAVNYERMNVGWGQVRFGGKTGV